RGHGAKGHRDARHSHGARHRGAGGKRPGAPAPRAVPARLHRRPLAGTPQRRIAPEMDPHGHAGATARRCQTRRSDHPRLHLEANAEARRFRFQNINSAPPPLGVDLRVQCYGWSVALVVGRPIGAAGLRPASGRGRGGLLHESRFPAGRGVRSLRDSQTMEARMIIKEKLTMFLATFVLGAAVAALGQTTGSSGTSAGAQGTVTSPQAGQTGQTGTTGTAGTSTNQTGTGTSSTTSGTLGTDQGTAGTSGSVGSSTTGQTG